MTYFDELDEIRIRGKMSEQTRELAHALRTVISDVTDFAGDLELMTGESTCHNGFDELKERGVSSMESLCRLHQLIEKLISE